MDVNPDVAIDPGGQLAELAFQCSIASRRRSCEGKSPGRATGQQKRQSERPGSQYHDAAIVICFIMPCMKWGRLSVSSGIQQIRA